MRRENKRPAREKTRYNLKGDYQQKQGEMKHDSLSRSCLIYFQFYKRKENMWRIENVVFIEQVDYDTCTICGNHDHKQQQQQQQVGTNESEQFSNKT